MYLDHNEHIEKEFSNYVNYIEIEFPNYAD